jgi:hypothetical protein
MLCCGSFYYDRWDLDPRLRFVKLFMMGTVTSSLCEVTVTISEYLHSLQNSRHFDWRETPMIGCYGILTMVSLTEKSWEVVLDGIHECLSFQTPEIKAALQIPMPCS